MFGMVTRCYVCGYTLHDGPPSIEEMAYENKCDFCTKLYDYFPALDIVPRVHGRLTGHDWRFTHHILLSHSYGMCECGYEFVPKTSQDYGVSINRGMRLHEAWALYPMAVDAIMELMPMLNVGTHEDYIPDVPRSLHKLNVETRKAAKRKIRKPRVHLTEELAVELGVDFYEHRGLDGSAFRTSKKGDRYGYISFEIGFVQWNVEGNAVEFPSQLRSLTFFRFANGFRIRAAYQSRVVSGGKVIYPVHLVDYIWFDHLSQPVRVKKVRDSRLNYIDQWPQVMRHYSKMFDMLKGE